MNLVVALSAAQLAKHRTEAAEEMAADTTARTAKCTLQCVHHAAKKPKFRSSPEATDLYIAGTAFSLPAKN